MWFLLQHWNRYNRTPRYLQDNTGRMWPGSCQWSWRKSALWRTDIGCRRIKYRFFLNIIQFDTKCLQNMYHNSFGNFFVGWSRDYCLVWSIDKQIPVVIFQLRQFFLKLHVISFGPSINNVIFQKRKFFPKSRGGN